jgi:DNA-binding response OmpR family regulator
MEPDESRKRLDEILIEKGLISQDEIKEALLSQREEGGKLGSHLLRHGYINETGLVDALAAQMDCPGIVLTSKEIPGDILERVPQEVALARKVMPFEFNSDHNVLKIACEDPTDQNLIAELSFISSGAQIELHVAAQIALDAAISRHYMGQEIPIFDAAKPAVLLVTDEGQAGQLESLLQAYEYEVVLCTSTDRVVDLMEDQRFHSVLIRESMTINSPDLVAKVRRMSPTTNIRCYKDASCLVIKDVWSIDSDLFLKNIDLLTSLLSSKAQLPVNHSIRVARYAGQLCRRLNLPESDRLLITNAAYLHDLATSYYGAEHIEDHQQTIQLTLNLLASLNYSTEVLQILRCMYQDLPEDHATRLPLEVLGGNVLTAVDIVCQTIPSDQHLSFDKFDAIKGNLRARADISLIAEVVEGLIGMLQSRILDSHSASGATQIMVYSDDPETRRLLDTRLRSEGFRTVIHTCTASLIELYHRSKPDIIILGIGGDNIGVACILDELAAAGVSLDSTPTVLLTSGLSGSNIVAFLDRGLEDVILLDRNLDLLVCKLNTLTSRPEPPSQEAEPEDRPVNQNLQVGELPPKTQGRLTDINLVDLLQMLGPARKTVKIDIKPDGPGTGRLTICLDKGQIVYAATQDRTGPDAVYQALGWTDGTWEMEPASAEGFPPSNNDRSNEYILMEGCRALDEKLEIEVLA